MTSTRHVHLLHNPKAGDQDHIKEELIRAIQSYGLTCQYASIKEKGWNRFKDDTALVIIAGGDGTVREVMKKLLDRRILDKRLAVTLLPSGTANNFAKTLDISPGWSDFERRVVAWKLKKIDIGAITNLRKANFFLEGLGYGLIPKLIKRMEEDKLEAETADQELRVALEKLVEIAEQYSPRRAKITVDGQVYENDYLLVEVLNIKSVGPNLILAPNANPTDGKFEVVLLKESDRTAFINYLKRLLKHQAGDGPGEVPWKTIKAARDVSIVCEGRLIHVDDELITLKKGKVINIEVRPGIVDFIT